MKMQTEAAAAGGQGRLMIRQVWANNVESEFQAIRQVAERFPYVSMDTEFPGVIHCPSKHHATLTPSERYAALKANVDALHLIQVGLAFAASPDAPPAVAFEINLREFDPRVHRHNPSSVALLAGHGLDFARQRRQGVDARVFAALLMSSGLVCSGSGSGAPTWVTFHSAYDFGYLVKLLMGRKLPRTLPEFLGLVRVFFGDQVYDARHVMGSCAGLYGGLDALAAQLGVERAAGMSHQAGSDAALTWDVFRRIREVYFAGNTRQGQGVGNFAGVLYGLELELDLAAAPAPAADNGNGNGNRNNKNKCGSGNGAGGRGNNRRAVAALR
ncbi:probable CCR4-associated factor 1 homolog 11 [Aegilops tauschii subsp. strangulata]|nr:probable CCR4-associated factor 1 homolog 11 [Aegilops tauschii subsp. strangulata]